MRPARFQPASDQSLLVYFGGAITPESGERVLKLLHLLESEPLPHVRNLHPAYASLLIKFDPLKTRHAALEAALRKYLDRLDALHLPEPRVIEIPVCYGEDFGPDLADLAALHNLTPQQVIDAHASAAYSVCFLGFVPGFAYLAGLPDALATPRLATPRREIPAGSVGIAGHQTGVYPCATPGGWRLIGRTPLKMFDAARPSMSLLATGDRVRFTPVSHNQFVEMERDGAHKPS
jgi:KipI family sensor histidine kinase inhibitor